MTAMEQVPRDNDLYMLHWAYHTWTRQQEEDYHQIPNGNLRRQETNEQNNSAITGLVF